jgi:hypothetical protein
MMVLINVPGLALSSWFWALRVGLPVLSSAGESLTKTVTVVGVEAVPSVAVY